MQTERPSHYFQFLRLFVRYASHVSQLFISMLLLMLLGGFAISKMEDVGFGDAIYFAFITGLSIGYGDIHPLTTLGKIVSVGIGLVGVLFVGLTIAVATRAMHDLAKQAQSDQR